MTLGVTPSPPSALVGPECGGPGEREPGRDTCLQPGCAWGALGAGDQSFPKKGCVTTLPQPPSLSGSPASTFLFSSFPPACLLCGALL